MIFVLWEMSVLASNSEDRLEIINVTDPHHPFEMTNYTGDNVFGMCSDGQYAYLSCSSGLRVLNMTDPMNPTLESLVAMSSSGEEMCLAGNLACVIDFEEGITFFDVSNPAIPSYVSSINDAMISLDVSIEGNTAFLAGFEGIYSIDIENPESPEVFDKWNFNYLQAVGSSPGFCYTTYLSTFYVIENSTMTSVATLPTENYPYYVFVEDPLALVISTGIR